jgi:hypothetical protein
LQLVKNQLQQIVRSRPSSAISDNSLDMKEGDLYEAKFRNRTHKIFDLRSVHSIPNAD